MYIYICVTRPRLSAIGNEWLCFCACAAILRVTPHSFSWLRSLSQALHFNNRHSLYKYYGWPSLAQLMPFTYMLHFDNHPSVYKYYGWPPSLAQLMAFTYMLHFDNHTSVYKYYGWPSFAWCSHTITILFTFALPPPNGGEFQEVSSLLLLD